MASQQKIDFKNFSWLNIVKPSKKELDDLGERYRFHPLDIADCLTVSHRSKIDVYDRYAFLVLLFPIYNRRTREIITEELNIFISPDNLVTIHRGNLEIFNNLFRLFQTTPALRSDYTDQSPERLLYEILNKLFVYVFPMIEHLGDDCDTIQKAIFGGKQKKMITEILLIRRNITDFRKIMQVHKNVLKKAVNYFKQSPRFGMKATDAYFESLVDYTKEIWDVLENLKERIEALQQSNESQISLRLSDIMRILTVISVIILPATLLASVFAMDVIQGMPLINRPNGFWYIIGGMVIVMVTMVTIFKKKDWL